MSKTKIAASLEKDEKPPKEITEEKYQKLVHNYEFAIYTFNHVVDDRACEKHMIVIRKKNPKCIVRFTRYEDLLIYRRNKDFSAWSGNSSELRCICQFLQYVLIDNYSKYRIRDVSDITKEMIEQWIWEYASTPLKNGEFPRNDNVILHRNAVCQFIWLLCDKGKMNHIKKRDVLIHHNVERRTEDGYLTTPQKTAEYMIPVRFYDTDTGLRQLNRDMPEKIIPMFIKTAEVYDPELTFAIVASAYIGFRPGEVCNMRRRDSKYGPGLILTLDEGEVTAIQFDLHKEFALRTDGKSTGGVKRERFQEVFGCFVGVVNYYYEKHLKLIKDKPCDSSMPMFLNKCIDKDAGIYQAMTKSGYRRRIKRIYQKVLEQCKNSNDKELNRFYDKMTAMNYSWGPHSFRHWYTVRLIQYGCDQIMLKDFRGDKQVASAEDYIKEKGVLRKEFQNKSHELGKLIRMIEEV